MTDISKARQRLRDLARLPVESTRTINFKGMEEPVDYTFVVGMLGEVASPLFMAVQDVLTLLEEQREGHKRWEGDPASDTALILIDDIEAVVLKALES